jgi:hypothetical protein
MARKANVAHHIHKRDGTIGAHSSYGPDPRSSKG